MISVPIYTEPHPLRSLSFCITDHIYAAFIKYINIEAIILIKNDLMSVVECIHNSDRFVIIRVGDIVCISVYFPCSGTTDRSLLYSELLNDI